MLFHLVSTLSQCTQGCILTVIRLNQGTWTQGKPSLIVAITTAVMDVASYTDYPQLKHMYMWPTIQ